MKILFLCISEYSGHKSAMTAAMNAVIKTAPDAECHGLNFFNYIPKKIVKTIDGAYYSIIEKKPGIWSFLRDSNLVRNLIKPFEILFCFFITIPFYFKILKNNKYDIIVCTQAFPCSCISLLKKCRLIKSKLIAIITDYNINPYWIRNNIDNFILPHDSLKTILTKKNIDETKIKVFGIPIQDKFKTTSDITSLKQKYNIKSDSFVILIMGGSLGLRGIEDVTSSLKSEQNLHLIVSAASNTALENRLKQEYSEYKNITILGYVDNVDQLMDISDILICKPGGGTVAEALAKGIKMITINPIPGQEEKNKDFLVKNNLSYFAETLEDIKNIILQEKQKGSYTKKCSDHGFPNSAEHTANLILRDVVIIVK